MKHIFVVDDEANIRELIRKYLEKENFKVSVFSNGRYLLEEVVSLKPDLIVLDIMMEGPSGLDLCKSIRASHDIPILFVSARDEEIDRIIGLELGADDYLSKPFSPRELVVRIKNILRRVERKSSNAVHKDLMLYPDERRVTANTVDLKLTGKEYEVMELLLQHIRIPFTREQLMERIWGYDSEGEFRLVDDVVKRLRKKLKDAQSVVEIVTVWGYGYKIDD